MSDYYNNNSKRYIADTLHCDMAEEYKIFLKYMPKQGTILDIGFGSGRDMIYFSSLGYKTVGIDPTLNFINNMTKLNYEVYKTTLEDFTTKETYDGLWACASLLHSHDLKKSFSICAKLLQKGGAFYASFKYGNFTGIKNERFFVYLTEESFTTYIDLHEFIVKETFITVDVRENRPDEKWLNVILIKK
ncbi:MAG: methyltransferase domain-containing protein [Bacilli bacterium]